VRRFARRTERSTTTSVPTRTTGERQTTHLATASR
jgi:hypothetical protein